MLFKLFGQPVRATSSPIMAALVSWKYQQNIIKDNKYDIHKLIG